MSFELGFDFDGRRHVAVRAKVDVELAGRLVPMSAAGLIVIDVEGDHAFYSVHPGCESELVPRPGELMIRCDDRHDIIRLDD